MKEASTSTFGGGERSVGLLLDGAAERRLEVRVVDGLGALDHVFGALGREGVGNTGVGNTPGVCNTPLQAGGLQIVDALEAVGDPARSVGREADAAGGLQGLWMGPSSRLLK